MQYWDKVLFPYFTATIHGQKYLTLNEEEMYSEFNTLALRAITAFKFPHIALTYSKEDNVFINEDDEEMHIERYYFTNELGFSEINVILAWMKYFWYEMLISNSDNYQNLYFDSNIKMYSPGNLISAFEKSRTAAYKDAYALEMSYGRVNEDGDPAFGDINVDDE